MAVVPSDGLGWRVQDHGQGDVEDQAHHDDRRDRPAQALEDPAPAKCAPGPIAHLVRSDRGDHRDQDGSEGSNRWLDEDRRGGNSSLSDDDEVEGSARRISHQMRRSPHSQSIQPGHRHAPLIAQVVQPKRGSSRQSLALGQSRPSGPVSSGRSRIPAEWTDAMRRLPTYSSQFRVVIEPQCS